MKKWILFLILTVAALWNPAKSTDIGALIPVELVQIQRTEYGFSVETDTKNCGTGRTLSLAFADLKEKASGKIFLETAEYVLLGENTLDSAASLPDYFRPGTQVYRAPPLENLSAAAEYLEQHGITSPLFRLGKWEAIPRLRKEEGGLKFESGKPE